MNEVYDISLIVLTVLVDFLFLFRYYTNTQVLRNGDLDTIVQYFCRRIPTKEMIFFLVGFLNPLILLDLGFVQSLGIGLVLYFVLHRLSERNFFRHMKGRSMKVLSVKSVKIISINNAGKGVGTIRPHPLDSEEVKVDLRSVSNKSYSPGDSAKVVGIDYTTLLIE